MISRISVTTNPRIFQETDSRFSTLSSSASKSNQEISCIFLLLPHQLDMKTTVKCWQDFLWYFWHHRSIRTYCVCNFTRYLVMKLLYHNGKKTEGKKPSQIKMRKLLLNSSDSFTSSVNTNSQIHFTKWMPFIQV